MILEMVRCCGLGRVSDRVISHANVAIEMMSGDAFNECVTMAAIRVC